MIVSRLELANFRNYESAEVELASGFNVFVGENGQGKTNLIEALGYLSTQSSHRVTSDHAMIRSGYDAAVIRARLDHAGRSVIAEVQLNRAGANRAQINGSAVKPRELARYFSSVLFAPEDLAIVRGEPSGRRRFLDELLTLRNPRFGAVISDYDRVLRQRNTLLKSMRAAGVKAQTGTLDIWDDKLLQIGTELIVARAALIDSLSPLVNAAYLSVAGAEHTTQLRTRSSFEGHGEDELSDEIVPTDRNFADPDRVAMDFAAALEARRSSERDRGVTLVGPHRDDLVLVLNGLPARGYASHGESWSFALALKLASAELLRSESSAGDPVLILDDVFAELDRARRARLAAAVQRFEQVIITAAVHEDVPSELVGNVIRISAGRVVGVES